MMLGCFGYPEPFRQSQGSAYGYFRAIRKSFLILIVGSTRIPAYDYLYVI